MSRDTRGWPAASTARAAAARRPRPEAGFTLVELVVATVILLVAILLACELFAESGRLLHHSIRRARDPWTLIAAELLRNDLRADPGPALMVGLWYPQHPHDQLQLRVRDEIVVWFRSPRGELVRQVNGTRHAYLHDVRSFRWRLLPGPATEVWVRFHVSSPYLRQLAGALPRSDPGEDQDLHLIVVNRGGATEW